MILKKRNVVIEFYRNHLVKLEKENFIFKILDPKKRPNNF